MVSHPLRNSPLPGANGLPNRLVGDPPQQAESNCFDGGEGEEENGVTSLYITEWTPLPQEHSGRT